MRFSQWQRGCVLACLSLLPLTPALAFDYFQTLPETPLVPADNPLTPAKIALGKKLFFDPQLLGPHSTLSCNSCHDVAKGGADGRAASSGQGGRKTRRSTPALWNIGMQTVFYRDGRATSLESQTLDHLRDPVISAWPDLGALVSQLAQSPAYQQAFAAAFSNGLISGDNLAAALANFERVLLAKNSPFDRHLRGDASALTEKQLRGMQAFGDAGCLACHFGANFAGPAPGPALGLGDGFYELFPNNLGSEYDRRYRLTEDSGRYAFTGHPGERYMWRVASLRNIELSAPYFHNGSVKTLPEAVRVMAKTQFGKVLPDATVEEIVEFLKSLTGETPSVVAEEADRRGK